MGSIPIPATLKLYLGGKTMDKPKIEYFHPEYFSHNERANEIHDKIEMFVKHIIEEEIAKGGSPRDVGNIAHAAVSLAEASAVMMYGVNLRRNSNDKSNNT